MPITKIDSKSYLTYSLFKDDFDKTHNYELDESFEKSESVDSFTTSKKSEEAEEVNMKYY